MVRETFDVLSKPVGLIAFLPLLGALLTYLIGRRLPHLAGWIATGASAAAFFLTLLFVNQLPETAIIEHLVFSWITVGNLHIDFAFRMDRLAAVMCLVITGIGSLIHLYSISYMHEDPSRPRFFAYLNLFMFSMLVLVLGANLPVLFVGWEGVGLCSYLLIGFWFSNPAYAAAGRKAFVVNRIGDAGFLVGMFLLFQHFGTLDTLELSRAIGDQPGLVGLYSVVAACLFIGACGKSAQLPLFVWLPDAMAGPTPVSALIHAATMVTAGIYMMARMHVLFALAPLVMFWITVIAVVTAFVAGTTALAQNDIKKVLAYSTVSQLGFMFIAAGCGAFWVALFHVVTHAFFKACLFLGAGSVIHGCHHEQDMRHMGGLARHMPLTAITYGVSTLAIAGIFPFAGYQSKHAILAALGGATNPYIGPWVAILLGVVSVTAFITAFYMTRSFAMTFLGSYRGHAHPHESPILMTLPLLVLGALATGGGLYLASGLGHPRLQEYLSPSLPILGGVHGHETVLQALMGSWVGIVGVVLGLLLYTRFSGFPGLVARMTRPLELLFSRKYFLDEIYHVLIVRPLEWSGSFLWRFVDQGTIDGGVNGTASVLQASGQALRFTQTGQVRHYALFMFVATLLFVAFYFVL